MSSMTVAEFKDKLSEALSRVESGEEITIYRRQHPIALLRAISKTSTPQSWSEVKGWLDNNEVDELEKSTRRLRTFSARNPFQS
ncbi:MAG: type II toxin-antitoxin system Phd/YefM family antitoxin [Candidatus Methylacidiphilales bacterium]